MCPASPSCSSYDCTHTHTIVGARGCRRRVLQEGACRHSTAATLFPDSPPANELSHVDNELAAT
eukprot:13487160-Alexandrium_andersonii.AAC.1